MTPYGIKSFKDFQRDLEQTRQQPVAFVEAKNHLREHYDGLEAVSSFIGDGGSIFDCVPFELQPGLKGATNKTMPVAPDLPYSGDSPNKGVTAGQRVGPQFRDMAGNQMVAPEGTIPIRRITPNQIERLGGLDMFRRGVPAPMASNIDDGATHWHAAARQVVSNIGMTGKFSIHKNAINGSKQHIFSDSQLWIYSARTIKQTIELCVMCYPLKYNTSDPVLIVHGTRDNYTSNLWDLESGIFVQTNPNWLLGGRISPISTIDGNQYYMQMSCKKDGDKWWVYYGGESSADAVGYYPTSYYAVTSDNDLAVSSTYFDVGGEVTYIPGLTPVSMPAMGSGLAGSANFKKSAYVRDVRYYPAAGGSTNATLSTATSGLVDTQHGFAAVRQRYTAPWSETLWYGGPGIP